MLWRRLERGLAFLGNDQWHDSVFYANLYLNLRLVFYILWPVMSEIRLGRTAERLKLLTDFKSRKLALKNRRYSNMAILFGLSKLLVYVALIHFLR